MLKEDDFLDGLSSVHHKMDAIKNAGKSTKHPDRQHKPCYPK